MVIGFKYISLKRFRYCSIFSIALTHRYKTKLLAIKLNTNYFKPIILKFKIVICKRNSKIIHNFCTRKDNTRLIGGDNASGGNFFNISVFRKNASKYAKLLVEQDVFDN